MNVSTDATDETNQPVTKRRWGFEWRSRAAIFGIPLVHVAIGRGPSGRLLVAKGFIAVGQFALGGITIAQFGVGLIFGFGQFMCGFAAVGQIVAGVLFAVGQFAMGLLAVGQIAVGLFALGQVAWGRHLWTPNRADMEAVALFYTIYEKVMNLF